MYYTFFCAHECAEHVIQISIICSWTVQLALVTVHMLGYLCDNIGLILACLPSGSTDATASASRYITKPSGIPILSPVLFMHVGDPYIPPFKIRRIFDLLVSPPFLDIYSNLSIYAHTCIYPNPLPLPLLHPYFVIVVLQ